MKWWQWILFAVGIGLILAATIYFWGFASCGTIKKYNLNAPGRCIQ